MSIGTVALSLGLIDKDFKKGLDRAESEIKKSVDNFKNIIVASKLGSYLFSGAEQYIDKQLSKVNSQMSALASGFSQEQVDTITELGEKFKWIGTSAENATESLTRFVLTGKSTEFNSLGIYLDENTKAIIGAMDETERYQWVLENIPERIENVKDALGQNTLNMIQMKETTDQLKESLGASFLQVLNDIINAFGGIQNAMKITLAAFATYKIATIIGNVAIGISKSIAQGGVFGAPVAIAMGVAALASIGAIIGASLAVGSALDNIESPSSTKTDASKTETSSSVVVVTNDRWGQTQEVISNRSGGNSSSVQTNYGASKYWN